VHFNVAHQMIHRFDRSADVRKLVTHLVPKFLATRPTRPSGSDYDVNNGAFGRRCIRDGYQLAYFDSTRKAPCSGA
jgi:hypothetical protein